MDSKLLIAESAAYHMEMPDLNFPMGCAKWHNPAPNINSLKMESSSPLAKQKETDKQRGLSGKVLSPR